MEEKKGKKQIDCSHASWQTAFNFSGRPKRLQCIPSSPWSWLLRKMELLKNDT